MDAGEKSADLHGALITCLLHDAFSLVDAVRISTCSYALHNTIVAQLFVGNYQLARTWLLEAVEAAAACRDCSKAHRVWHARAIRWILRASRIPKPVLQLESSKLLGIDRIPLSIAYLLVAAGLQCDYKQLMDGVHKRVHGINNWAAASWLQYLPTHLTEEAELLCFKQSKYDGLKMDLQTVIDMSYLAINMFPADVDPLVLAENDELCCPTLPSPASILKQLGKTNATASLEAEDVQLLLKSAVDVLIHRTQGFGPCCSPGQGCDSNLHSKSEREAAVSRPAAGDVSAANPAVHSGAISAILQELCRLPAAAQLAPETVKELITSAANSGLYHTGVRELCRLPGAAKLTSTAVASILRAAIEQGFASAHATEVHFSIGELCKHLRGADRISAEAAGDLCRTAISNLAEHSKQQGGLQETYPVLSGHFFRLWGVGNMPAEAVHDLLQLAIETKLEVRNIPSKLIEVYVFRLCSLPAAHEIDTDAVWQLLRQAKPLGAYVCKLLSRLLGDVITDDVADRLGIDEL